jgi:hypothetical protein
MIAKLFSRTPLHEHADPAQRIVGVSELPQESAEFSRLLLADPAPEVRAAAAARCADLAALATAWQGETDEPVRKALAAALAAALASTPDAVRAKALLETDAVSDAVRCDVARRAQDADRRRLAIAAVREEEPLVDLALSAEHAETRLAAAERVGSTEALHKLADAAKSKDRGVARLARQRIDAIESQQGQIEQADAILGLLGTLADKPGPILSELIDLDRRWQALRMEGDAARVAQWEEARKRVHTRLEREQDIQRRRLRFEQDGSRWIARLAKPAEALAIAALQEQLAELQAQAHEWGDAALQGRLDDAAARIAKWTQELESQVDAEFLVVEAERYAAAHQAQRLARSAQAVSEATANQLSALAEAGAESMAGDATPAHSSESPPAESPPAAAVPPSPVVEPSADAASESQAVESSPAAPATEGYAALQPAAAEPATQSSVTVPPAAEPAAAPSVHDSAGEAAVEPAVEPFADLVPDSAADPAAESVADLIPDPAADPAAEPVADLVSDPTAELAADPAAEPALESASTEVRLQQRWRALDPAARTPALTRRFEAAFQAIEQLKAAQDLAANQHVSAVRQRLHTLLHSAEQALAGGQLQKARAAADEIKPIRSAAGLLPKPTLQRLGRLLHQLSELERWESFGQQGARVRLCERAEALAAQTVDPVRLAADVQALRNEWKALDHQHAGVPKGLWERFDGACRKAYAPAAKHFAQLSTQRKQARKQRDEFIDATAAHIPSLLTEPPDWRAIERWLRETDRTWREGTLGSVEPGAWKELDARLKGVVGPLREALATAREQAKSARQALIAEAAALTARAGERDTPSQVKAIQLRWQLQAKALPLAQRDEQPLWEQFRAACDAVFNARQSRRKEEDQRKGEHRAGLVELCARMEKLAADTSQSEQEMRRTAREIQEQWKKPAGPPDQSLSALEARFRGARAAVDAALAAREREREAAVWQTLAEKERLCEELDRRACAGGQSAADSAGPTPAAEGWSALPALPDAWERAMAARRDAALRALADKKARDEHAQRVQQSGAARRGRLLELEILLGIGTPPEFQADRLALQVQQLRQRFSGAPAPSAGSGPGAHNAASGRAGSRGIAGGAAGEILLAWCAEPGISEKADRHRAERVFAKLAQPR